MTARKDSSLMYMVSLGAFGVGLMIGLAARHAGSPPPVRAVDREPQMIFYLPDRAATDTVDGASSAPSLLLPTRGQADARRELLVQ